MTDAEREAVERIIDGQDPLAFQAHLLAAWHFKLHRGHEPAIEELRDYLLSGQMQTRNFWDHELQRRTDVSH